MKKSRIARPIAAVASPAVRSLPLVALLVDTQAELFELMVRSGLRVLDAMLEEDRTALCGPRYVHQPARAASRAGTVPSSANTTGSSRTGTVTIAEQTFTLTQSGAAAPSAPDPDCSATLGAITASVGEGAAGGSVAVTIAVGCAWTATSNASHITVTSGASGTGSGAVSYSVTANTTGLSRIGTITIAEQTFTLTQGGAACSATLSPTTASLGAGAASGTLAVTIATGCAWTATSNASYITATSGSTGTGTGTVGYSVAANTTGSSRTGTVTIAQQTFTVTQIGAVNCTATLSPSSATVTEAATSGSVAVTLPSSECAWTATSNASWITVTGGASGAGSGTVSYSVPAFATTDDGYPSRNGTVTIAQQTFTLTQTAPSCGSSSVTLSPTSATFTGAGGTGTVSVTIPAGCAWDVLPNIHPDVSWLTIESPGVRVGPSTVTYTVVPNTTGNSRSHFHGFAGKSFQISQSTDGAPNCGATLSPTSATVTGAATSGSVAVALPSSECAWTTTSNASWLTVTGGASGAGSGTVSYSVSELTPADMAYPTRSATLTIAQQTFALTQTVPTCADVTISPTYAEFTEAGGTGAVTITVAAGCAYDVLPSISQTWLTIDDPGVRVGPSTATYTVAPNTTGNSRHHFHSFGGKNLELFQTADGAPDCTATLSPSSATVTEAATSGSVAVTLPSSACAWAATSNASWITVTGGASGTGSGTVSYSIAELTSSDLSYPSRNGTVTIAQQTFTLTQTAPSCGSSSVTLSPTSATFTGAGGTGTVSVTIPAGCAWDVLPNIHPDVSWLTIESPGVRVGPSTVTYTVAPNTTRNNRSHFHGFAGKSFQISQSAEDAADCSATLSPTTASVGDGATSGSVAVTIATGCAWTATSNASYITVTSGSSATGSGTVGYSVAANTTGTSRSGTVTIAEQTFTVTQSGVSCSATLSPTTASVGDGATSGSVAVTIATGCAWTATSNASYITVTSGSSGTGSGTVSYNVAANTTSTSRSGTLTIAGQSVTVTQAAPACTTPAAPTLLSASASSFQTVAFTWSAVSGATTYIIEAAKVPEGTVDLSWIVSGTSYTWTTGLSGRPGVTYSADVYARNSCGSSDRSNALIFTFPS